MLIINNVPLISSILDITVPSLTSDTIFRCREYKEELFLEHCNHNLDNQGILAC